MKVTINKIRVELQEVAEAHEMINSFFWGDFHRAWKEKSLTYPLVCGYVSSGGSLSKNLTNVPLTIVVADKVFKDYSSLNDTESDTLQVCRHIFNTLNMSPRWNDLIRVNSANVEKFIDRGDDEIAGHILNMNVDVKDSYSICNLPMGDYDFESTAQNGCQGVLIVNSDGTFTFNAPSGSIVELDDTPVTVRNVSGDEVGSGDVPSVTGGVITVPDCPVSGDGEAVLKDTDGNVLSSTSVPPESTVDIEAPDSNYVVEYENGTPIESGSILSGGNKTIQVANPIVCEDAIVENSDATYTDTVASGGTLVLPDETINITDQDNNIIDTITFPVYTPVSIDIDSYCTPCPPAVSRSTATLMKTGQTTSYRTGDDGDIQAGREDDFLTLDTAPVHNDGSATINTTTNRFTDTLGGQTYANNIVLDWSTWNGSTLLGVQTNLTLTGNINWDDAIDYCVAFTLGGFSGWRMWNYKEFVNFIDIEKTVHFNFPPFNNINALQFWLASNTSAEGFVASATYRTIGRALKTGASGRAFPVRTFSLSTSNILS